MWTPGVAGSLRRAEVRQVKAARVRGRRAHIVRRRDAGCLTEGASIIVCFLGAGRRSALLAQAINQSPEPLDGALAHVTDRLGTTRARRSPLSDPYPQRPVTDPVLGGVLRLGPTGPTPASRDTCTALVLQQLLPHGAEIVAPDGIPAGSANIISLLAGPASRAGGASG
jgi:hypothetical protein